MEAYRPHRVVRGLAGFLSAIYIAGWVAVGLMVVVLALVELSASHGGGKNFHFGVPVTVALDELRVPAAWNGATASIGLSKTEASLDVPFTLVPRWFRAASYGGLLVLCGIVLAFLRQLRGLFRSARDGAPFDPRNTARLRWMGVLLVAAHVSGKAFSAWQATIVLRTITNSPTLLQSPVPLDEKVLFALDEWILLVALLLFALGEIFRRGTALEDEQSLVV